LIGKEHFAVDGCKLPSNASKQWSGTHRELDEKRKKLERVAERVATGLIGARPHRRSGDPGPAENSTPGRASGHDRLTQ
jgi:hypothetical protein